MIWLLRGGATDVYTLITNLASLQKRLPDTHLSSLTPYILADSAGAYPASGLAAPNPVDPILLPATFKKNIRRYLSPDRREAEAALSEDIGDTLVCDSTLPISISTTNITGTLRPDYFTHFPQAYIDQHPGLRPPANRNGNVTLAKAAMASSAFAPKLGEFRINDQRFMDMAFIETHDTNLVEFYKAHSAACPNRRLVCVIFGNNYSDLRIDQAEQLSLSGLNRHFADAVRLRVQKGIVNLAETLFGKENVFDLSLYIKQPFSGPSSGPISDAFRRDDAAITERIAWTEAVLKQSLSHQKKLDQLAALIRRNEALNLAASSLQSAASPPAEPDISFESPLRGRERLLIQLQNYLPQAALLLTLIGQEIKPVVEAARPVVRVTADLAISSLRGLGGYLQNQWTTNAEPWLDRQLDSAGRKLLPNSPQRLATTLPSQTRSSEPHTPPESDYTPL